MEHYFEELSLLRPPVYNPSLYFQSIPQSIPNTNKKISLFSWNSELNFLTLLRKGKTIKTKHYESQEKHRKQN